MITFVSIKELFMRLIFIDLFGLDPGFGIVLIIFFIFVGLFACSFIGILIYAITKYIKQNRKQGHQIYYRGMPLKEDNNDKASNDFGKAYGLSETSEESYERSQISTSEEKSFCESCGAKLITKSDKFCPKCGKSRK
jgi:ABC-type transport system involved in multi-copper enzyme maturation permease subunit